MKNTTILLILSVLLFTACTSPATVPPSQLQTEVAAAIAATNASHSPTPAATNTPAATSTPRPTNTPAPTNTPQPTETHLPSETPIPPTVTPKPIGTLRVNYWLFEITAVYSDPGMNSSRQQVVLLGNLTNEGASTDTFVAYAKLLLRDSQGRQYKDDNVGTWAARSKYGTQSGAMINPGATVYIAVAFDALSSEKIFTIIPGTLVASWSGDITFTLP